jgi:hypothetical protein
VFAVARFHVSLQFTLQKQMSMRFHKLLHHSFKQKKAQHQSQSIKKRHRRILLWIWLRAWNERKNGLVFYVFAFRRDLKANKVLFQEIFKETQTFSFFDTFVDMFSNHFNHLKCLRQILIIRVIFLSTRQKFLKEKKGKKMKHFLVNSFGSLVL